MIKLESLFFSAPFFSAVDCLSVGVVFSILSFLGVTLAVNFPLELVGLDLSIDCLIDAACLDVLEMEPRLPPVAWD